MKHKIIKADGIQDAFYKVKKLYYGEFIENELVEVMGAVEIKGLSVEEVVELYGVLFYELEGDKVVRHYNENMDGNYTSLGDSYQLWDGAKYFN